MFPVANFNTNVQPKRKYGDDGAIPEVKRSKVPPNFAQSKLQSLRGKENQLTEFERAGAYYNKKYSDVN